MVNPSRRGGRPSDPVRQHLVEVRRGLLRLHKALIDAERAAYEAQSGTTSSGQFLQLLLQDPFFAWLRPFSALIVQIDEALAAADGVDPEAARGFVAEVRALLASLADAESGVRYEEIRRRDPDVLVAHVELRRRLGEPG